MNIKKTSVALSSVIAGVFLTGMKLVVGLLTGSMGIISEAAHSALDLGAAMLTYVAVKIGDKPADDTHPYGHGKIESVSALIETGLLFLTSFWIIYESVRRLIFGGVEVEVTWYAFVIMAISIVIDYSRSRALYKVAKDTKSQALEADALHFSSDIWSSFVVIIGLVCVVLGVSGADTIAALGVSLFILLAGYRLGKRTIDVLIDTAPEGIADIVRETLGRVEGVVGVGEIRARPLGPSVFIDAEIHVPRKVSLSHVDAIISRATKVIKEKIHGCDIIIRTKSIALTNETCVEVAQAVAAKHNISVHNIVVDNLNGKRYVSYDVELPKHLTVAAAHDIASHLETSIHDELGAEIELNTHIEPLDMQEFQSSDVEKEEMTRIEQVVKKLASAIDVISDVHHVLARRVHGDLFITLHCHTDGKRTLEESHLYAGKLKHSIQEHLPEVRRIVVHVEPKR